VLDLVIADLGVFPIDKGGTGMTLIEPAGGVSVDEVRAKTEAESEAALASMPAAAESRTCALDRGVAGTSCFQRSAPTYPFNNRQGGNAHEPGNELHGIVE